jgi:transposase
MRGQRWRPLIVTAAERAQVEARLAQRELSRRERERLAMVKARGLGQERSAICPWRGRSRRTVPYGRPRVRTAGVEGLTDQPRAGRPPRADAASCAALAQAVATYPPELGLPFDVWTAGRLSADLVETTGVRIAPGWVRVRRGQQEFGCGRPHHTLRHLRDAEEVAACEREVPAAGETRGPSPRALCIACRGGDPRRDHPLSVSGLASTGPAAHPPGGRHQSALDGVWPRRALGPRARRGAGGRADRGALPGLAGGARPPPGGDRTGELPDPRQWSLPHSQGAPCRARRPQGLAAGHLAGARQPAPQPQSTGVALPQPRCPQSPGPQLTRLCRRDAGRLAAPGRRAAGYRRSGAGLVLSGPPACSHRAATGSPPGRHGSPAAHALSQELTSAYLAVFC